MSLLIKAFIFTRFYVTLKINSTFLSKNIIHSIVYHNFKEKFDEKIILISLKINYVMEFYVNKSFFISFFKVNANRLFLFFIKLSFLQKIY